MTDKSLPPSATLGRREAEALSRALLDTANDDSLPSHQLARYVLSLPWQTREKAAPEDLEAIVEWIECEEFYNLMQTYRHSPAVPQDAVLEAYRAVKRFIAAEILDDRGERSTPSATAPIDPESEAANPVWDLVIHTCAQAWPAGLLTWDQSPTELIVQIINERDEARQQVKELLEKGL